MTDETLLIKQLKNVNTKETAFRELITLYKERLYWHIRKIVISHDDADDVLQNTFIKVFKNIDKFNFLKETNQIELQISGHKDFESEEFIDIIQLYRINSDLTCQYSKGDSDLMIKKEDISNNTFNQYLKMYNIDSQKINNMASEINETGFSLNKRNTLS